MLNNNLVLKITCVYLQDLEDFWYQTQCFRPHCVYHQQLPRMASLWRDLCNLHEPKSRGVVAVPMCVLETSLEAPY